ncbi:MAG TPA: hypothetical protein VFO54_04915 [Chryseosolibacter sp.]|nr:hypothetical protein [Chryseosolibacter sp.]
MMKKLNVLIMLALMVLSSGFSGKGIWIIDAQSRLTIQGSTNLNDFICKVDYCTGTDTLQYEENSARKEMCFTRSRMTVPVRSFDCGAKPISKDFWKTLKAETYPEMNIDFISLQNVYFKNKSHINGVVDITLAGVTARYTIKYFVTVKDNGTVLLQGTHAVNFSDFQLEAPEKLNGLIKVKEALKVDFNLLLKEV